MKETRNRSKKDNRNSEKSNVAVKPTDNITDDWLKNVEVFNEILKDTDKIREISKLMEKTYPEIYKYQKKLTSMVLGAFPSIERQLKEEDLDFRVRVLKIPFYKGGELQHDCVQKYMAEKQGVINLATGSKKIISDLFYVDIPILAPEAKGEALLYNQRKLFDGSIPQIQRKCLIKAQPIVGADRVYGYNGRWLIWRMVFNLKKVEEMAKDANEAVPLYAQRLAGFRFSRLFPFAGTTDGELSLIVTEVEEEENFKDDLGKMKDDFGLETKQIDTQITVSWDSIVELGILPYAAEPHLPQIGKRISQRLKENILRDAITDFGTFTEKDNVGEQKNKHERIRRIPQLMAYDMTQRGLEDVFHIFQKIPDSYMELYEIEGGGKSYG